VDNSLNFPKVDQSKTYKLKITQKMNAFKGFVIKEFYHILRDYRTMLILFGIPIAQVILFGYIITTEITDANIAILDKSKDEVTRQITQKIVSSGFFRLAENLESESEIQDVFKAGRAKEVIVFEADFAKKLKNAQSPEIELIADASDANTANLLVSYTSGIIQSYNQEVLQNNPQIMQIQPSIRMYYNPSMEGVYFFIPGIMAVILMLISALMTSVSVTREKEMGTMEILLVSPLKPLQIIIGKLTPYFLLSFVNAITVISLGYLVFGVPIKGSIILLMAESMVFILLALSLGLLISSVAKTQQVAMFMSMLGLMLPTMLLSGFIYPIENMPNWLQFVANIMPPKYYIIIVKDIMLKGTGLLYIWPETLILLGMTTFFIVVATKKFKIRLE
jgi:ABC-2 type transport system permease protein